MNKNESSVERAEYLYGRNVNLSYLPYWIAQVEMLERSYCPDRRMFKNVYSHIDPNRIALNDGAEVLMKAIRKKYNDSPQLMDEDVDLAKKELRKVIYEIKDFNVRCKDDFFAHGPRPIV